MLGGHDTPVCRVWTNHKPISRLLSHHLIGHSLRMFQCGGEEGSMHEKKKEKKEKKDEGTLADNLLVILIG